MATRPVTPASESDVTALSDRPLVVAMRCGSAAAIREFVVRFRPLLVTVAQRFVSTPLDPEELADDVLQDAVAHLLAPEAQVPASVRAYLVRSLRNRALNAVRAAARRRRAVAQAADAAGEEEPHFEHALAACASEHSVRASHGPAWDGPPATPPALARLAASLTATLSAEDQLLATWLGHHVPQQQIAIWLGLRYEAASKRVRRLRLRLHRLAQAYLEQAPAGDRPVIAAFLERAAHLGRAPRSGELSEASRRATARPARGVHERSSEGGTP